VQNQKPPFCIVADLQSSGVGSRANSWESIKGNLFFSFVLHTTDLPQDLPIQSSSIYFGYLFKESLKELGSKLWLKWPNDLYINESKIGGIITTLKDNYIICGIGLNLKKSKNYHAIDIKVDKKTLLNHFFKQLSYKKNWKEIFDKFSIEFEKSRAFCSHFEEKEIMLKDAKLNSDGSLSIDNKKIYSLR